MPVGLSGKQIRQEEDIYSMSLADRPVHGDVLSTSTVRRRVYVCTVHIEVIGIRPDSAIALGDDWRRGRPCGICEPQTCDRLLFLRSGIRA